MEERFSKRFKCFFNRGSITDDDDESENKIEYEICESKYDQRQLKIFQADF